MILDRRLWGRLLFALPAGLAALAVARWGQGWDWHLAWITGFAIGILTFAALRTLDRMRDVVRRR